MPKYAHLTLHADTNDHLFFVEIRDTPAGIQKGMMFREKWHPINGMLFIFPETEKRSMWMKDTPLPLDMLFLDDEQVVIGIVTNTRPNTTTPIPCPSKLASRYVLEIPAGIALKLELDVGDRLVRSQSEDDDD